MFSKAKKKEEELEIAQSALHLWGFTKAVLVFVEEDPNRIRSFLKVMTNVKGQPTKEDIQQTRDDMAKCIAWISQSMRLSESKIKEKK